MGYIGNLSLNNNGGNINVSNYGYIGNVNSQNQHGGNTNILNNGAINNLNSNTVGANTNIANNGFVNNLNATDTFDSTHILNNGHINNANLTANGALGYIGFQNNGSVGNVNAHANYGGQIDFNNFFGSVNNFFSQASGSSHGKPSQINIIS